MKECCCLLLCSLLVGSPFYLRTETTTLFTKEAMLRNIAGNVIAPGYQELAIQSRALSAAAGELAKQPDLATLEKTRNAWKNALLAARRLECFQAGPIADRDYKSSFYFWRVLPVRIEDVLKSERPLDRGYLEELGATTKGMFALEYLLYEPRPGTQRHLALAAGPDGERCRAYIAALALDLQIKAGELAKDWSDSGKDRAAAKFVAGGQATVNVLVNQLAMTIEAVAEQRLKFITLLPEPLTHQLDRIEGSRSGTSLQSVLAILKGAEKMYRGGEGLGLDDYLAHLCLPAETRLRDQFQAANKASEKIGAPLEEATTKDKTLLPAAYESTRTLEVLCKTDLASGLGVTLTFSSTDND